MTPFLATVLVVSGALSLFFIFRLLSGRRSVAQKSMYFVVLLVPVVGPLLYLFLSEEVPPQSPLLRNDGPRGAYTDKVIAIQTALEEARLQKARATTEATGSQNADGAERHS